jgi:hypothetical protein
MDLDTAFWPALWALATTVGTRPETLLAVWFAESGLEPKAQNPQGCIGLNQTCPSELGGPGFPNGDAAAYAASPASAQLAWIAPQVVSAQHLNGGPFRSAARYYQANFLPATLLTAKGPRDVIAGRNGPYAPQYGANTGLDVTADGFITLDDLGRYLQRRIALGGGALEGAIAQAYASRPPGAPWTSSRLTLFEPVGAERDDGSGPLVAGLFLALAFAGLRRRA